MRAADDGAEGADAGLARNRRNFASYGLAGKLIPGTARTFETMRGTRVSLRKSALAFVVFTAGIASSPAAFSEDANSQPAPDLSGGWARIGALVETFEAIPGYSAARP